MAKNRNKKKRNGVVSMDIAGETVSDLPQAMDTSESGALQIQLALRNSCIEYAAMDTSESGAQKPASGAHNIKLKKGREMKRSKNARKKKAIAKAISKNEKAFEKVTKIDGKTMRRISAKTLYD